MGDLPRPGLEPVSPALAGRFSTTAPPGKPLLFFFKFYLFMTVLGLHFCARAFSSCGKRGPLFIAVCGSLTIAASRCGAQVPDTQAQQLWLTGPVAPWHVGSSQTRARTRVPCIGRQILNHCATREARLSVLYIVVCVCQAFLVLTISELFLNVSSFF